MKKLMICFIGLSFFIHYSCSGGFEASEFAINLEYPDPDSNCEEGVPNDNTITIPFKWKPQGDIASFTLVINDDQIQITDFETDEEGFNIFNHDVNFNAAYEWQINSTQIDSEKRNFRTPIAEENNNNVPLAVFFNEQEFTPGTNSMDVKFEWEGGDLDNDGNLKYDAYWSPEEDISTTNNSGMSIDLTSPTVTFTILNFDPNKDYYLLVISKDGENSASSILKFRQF
ncbi:MAG: hypothetical protein ABJJ05_19380 [Maribacter litoralis]|uniref:hypothetical protein n=1 Tax=Maribacter litoralis TaxID=2059726 RepID=UPI00329702D6